MHACIDVVFSPATLVDQAAKIHHLTSRSRSTGRRAITTTTDKGARVCGIATRAGTLRRNGHVVAGLNSRNRQGVGVSGLLSWKGWKKIFHQKQVALVSQLMSSRTSRGKVEVRLCVLLPMFAAIHLTGGGESFRCRIALVRFLFAG